MTIGRNYHVFIDERGDSADGQYVDSAIDYHGALELAAEYGQIGDHFSIMRSTGHQLSLVSIGGIRNGGRMAVPELG